MCDFIFEHRERQRKKHFCLLRCLSAFATPIKLYFRCVFKLLPYVALAFSRSPFLYHLQTKLAAAATVVTTAAVVVVIAAAATTAAK